jgi:hypothetical protein
MKERHQFFYVNKITQLDCGGYYFDVESGYEIPFETNPTTGEHDFNNCKNCQESLRYLKDELTKKFNGDGGSPFPFCCKWHSNLARINKFNRNDFVNVPEITARKIIYTKQHILNNYNLENAYKTITDYIEYTAESFGIMPKGCGVPLFLDVYYRQLSDILDNIDNFPQNLKNDLKKYLLLRTTPTKGDIQTDINVLVATYKKWFNIFPFEISYFSGLKERLEDKFPLFYGTPQVNLFSGVATVKMFTKDMLVDYLLELTNKIITEVNGYILFNAGNLSDANKIKLELALSERKIKLEGGYVNNSQTEEQRYRKVLKEWLNDEQRFINEIAPLIKATTMPKYEYCELLRNYRFWSDNDASQKDRENIFDGKSDAEFLEMIHTKDFSAVHNGRKTQRVKYNISILSRLLGEDWGVAAAEKLNTTLDECKKRTGFCEYEEIKDMYLP